MTATDFTALVTNQPVLDLQVFADWLAGRSVADAVTRRLTTLRQSPHLLPNHSHSHSHSHSHRRHVHPNGSSSIPDSPAFGPIVHQRDHTLSAIPAHVHLHNNQHRDDLAAVRRHVSSASSSAAASPAQAHSQSLGSLSRRHLPSNKGTSTPPRTTASSTASLDGSASGTFPPASALVDYPSAESTSGRLSRRGSILLRDIRRAVGSVMLPLSFLSSSSSAGMHSTPSSSFPLPPPATAAGLAAGAGADPLISPAVALSVHLHVVQQYRLYVLADHFLHRPRAFLTQTVIPLPLAMRRIMIRAYYAFDERVMRELLGKKLNSRTRRELDEWVVANYTSSTSSAASATLSSSSSMGTASGGSPGVGMLAARRMLDNLKRIMKRTEDVPEGDPVVAVLLDEFALDVALARRYAAVHFFTTHRIDTSKRRLAAYTFTDLEFAATAFLDHWIRAKPLSSSFLAPASAHPAAAAAAEDTPESPSVPPHAAAASVYTTTTTTAQDDDTDALAALAADLREVKAYLLGSKDVVESLRVATYPVGHPPAHVRALLRHLISLGAGLAHAASRRSLLADLAERVVDASLAPGVAWSAAQIDACLAALAGALVDDVGATRGAVSPRAAAAWARWVQGVRVAAGRLVVRRVGRGERDEEVEVPEADGEGPAADEHAA